MISGITAAHARSDRVDSLVAQYAHKLPDSVAVIALGAYGRSELTPRADVEVLFLHRGGLDVPWVTETICYPLWERGIHIEPSVRTLEECASQVRRSWSAATSFLDARLIAGDTALSDDFVHQITQPWRRDRERLRHRLRTDAQHRHAAHASATASNNPDPVAGRGGLLDLVALRWLGVEQDERMASALEFLLSSISLAEDLTGHVPHHLSARLQDRLATGLNLETHFLTQLYEHARWIAFTLDGALTPVRDDRQLGSSCAIRDGQLIVDRPPPLERAPALGVRVANLVGLAPPSAELLEWASRAGKPIRWDQPTLDQFWLLLRAADWRAWDFLDVSGLLLRYLPELKHIRRQRGTSATGDLAIDSHSFLAVRRLHEWSESDDPLAQRALRPLRHRDWLYLSVLLHELSPEAASTVARRLELPEEAVESLAFAVGNHQLVAETATRRDLHDEDLLLELATRIHTRQRLSSLFLVASAHELAATPTAWSPWKADLMRQLFGRLEAALRQPSEVGPRRTRSLEQHRERIVRELQRRDMHASLPVVPRLPRRYVLTRTPAFVARHLALLGETPLSGGDVRMQAYRHRQPRLWDVLIVARDRPGLLATVAGVLALRGASVLAADVATCADGLVLDVFTVTGPSALRWQEINSDLQAALQGRSPIHALLGSRRFEPSEAEAVQVTVDNSASQFYSVVEVRAPDQVGLLYRITHTLHELGLDIHHARIATHPEGAFDVFYVWDLTGEKLDEQTADRIANTLAASL